MEPGDRAPVPDEFLETELDDVTLMSDAAVAEPHGGTSWWMCALIVVNAALGAGILNFPSAFAHAGGVLPAMVVHVVLVTMAGLSLLLLAWCLDLRPSDSYQDTIGLICGPWMRRSCAAFIFLYSYGTSITYLVIVGDQTDRIFADHVGPDFCQHWYLNRTFLIPISASVIILPLCFSRRIDFLKYASGLATLSIFYLIVVVGVLYSRSGSHHHSVQPSAPSSWTDMFSAVPAICFAYQCHVSAVPVYSCIVPHSLGNFLKTVLFALSICFFSYSLVGICGYLTFGSSVEPDIFSNYDTKDGLVVGAFLLFAIKNFLTYPILLFIGRLAVETLWRDWDCVGCGEPRRRVVVVLCWFLTSLLAALFVPNIAFVVPFLGALAALFIFIYPGFCLMKILDLMEPSLSGWRKRLCLSFSCFYLIFGAFLLGLTFVQGIVDGINMKMKNVVCS